MSTGGWMLLIAFGAALLMAGAVWLLRVLRRQVCLRRTDCCGKGCGCLFPVKRE